MRVPRQSTHLGMRVADLHSECLLTGHCFRSDPEGCFDRIGDWVVLVETHCQLGLGLQVLKVDQAVGRWDSLRKQSLCRCQLHKHHLAGQGPLRSRCPKPDRWLLGICNLNHTMASTLQTPS
jgi:hypothetical protein